MPTISTRDGIEIFYKDWGSGQPIVFSHGWPLSADDWDNQILFFLSKGFRVVAHDRRGHGRSAQVDFGHDMDHYAADAAAVVEHLDLRNAIHIGHSTGGGEATRYVARHGQPQGRVAKLVLIGAVPPIVVKTSANPGGLPIEARQPSMFYLVHRFVARNRLLVGGAATVAAALVLGATVSTWGFLQARAAEQQAQQERDRAEELRIQAERERVDAEWARDFANGILTATDPWESEGGSAAADVLDHRAAVDVDQWLARESCRGESSGDDSDDLKGKATIDRRASRSRVHGE